jgi:hypothetical protein
MTIAAPAPPTLADDQTGAPFKRSTATPPLDEVLNIIP